MKDVIEMLLNKQATLEADKDAEKALALEEIDIKYAERAGKISALLDMAGYIPPVAEVIDEADEQAVEPVAVPAETVVKDVPVTGQVVY